MLQTEPRLETHAILARTRHESIPSSRGIMTVSCLKYSSAVLTRISTIASFARLKEYSSISPLSVKPTAVNVTYCIKCKLTIDWAASTTAHGILSMINKGLMSNGGVRTSLDSTAHCYWYCWWFYQSTVEMLAFGSSVTSKVSVVGESRISGVLVMNACLVVVVTGSIVLITVVASSLVDALVDGISSSDCAVLDSFMSLSVKEESIYSSINGSSSAISTMEILYFASSFSSNESSASVTDKVETKDVVTLMLHKLTCPCTNVTIIRWIPFDKGRPQNAWVSWYVFQSVPGPFTSP